MWHSDQIHTNLNSESFFAVKQFDTLTEVLFLFLLLLVIIVLIKYLLFRTNTLKRKFFDRFYNKPKPDFTSGSMLPKPNSYRRASLIASYIKKESKIKKSEYPDNYKKDAVSFDSYLLKQLEELEVVLVNYSSNEEKKRPVNIFLNAPPGSGKSFLIENFIKYINDKHPTLERSYYYDENNQEFNLSTCKKDTDVQAKILEEIKKQFNIIKNFKSIGNSIPVFFIDEFDTRIKDLQAFSQFINLMWKGSFPDDSNKSKRKAIFFFATSLTIVEESLTKQLKDLVNLKIIEGKVNLYSTYNKSKWSSIKSMFRCKEPNLKNYSYYKLKNRIVSYNESSDWIIRREKLLNLFKSQKSIDKVNDFFDRIDYFLNIPGFDEVFEDRLKESEKNNDLYFADKENLVMILSNLNRFYGIKKIEKKALFALLIILHSTKRDLERRIYISKCPAGAICFSFNHLDCIY